MKKQFEKLHEMRPCRNAKVWVGTQTDPQQAWNSCERGDWMLWLLGKLSKGPRSKSRKRLVLATCECARLALKHVSKGENRPRLAIETAEAWTKGEAILSQVRKAAYAAAYAAYTAAYAADDAAYAAYAAAYAAYTADAADAAYAAAYAAYAAYTAKKETLKQCADIVRKHYPMAPKL